MTVDANAATLKSYAASVRVYGERTSRTVGGASKDWIDRVLRDLPSTAAIFEIGSAHGRDALYIRDRGFAITCSDAVEGFVSDLAGMGLDAIRFNVLTDSFDRQWDLILANAVLLHFTDAAFVHAVRKIVDALVPGGRFAFTLKAGEGAEWSHAKIGAPRYFRYWTAEALAAALAEHGLHDVVIKAVQTDRAHAEWLYVVVRRPRLPA